MAGRVVLAALFAVAAASALPLSASGRGSGSDVACEYVELGPTGPTGNELQITTSDYVGELTIDRDGELLVLSDGGGESVECAAPLAPSVTNVDAITLRVLRESVDSLILDLSRGPLAPGASVEPDGTAEIEVSLEAAPGTVLAVIGSSSADHIELGAIGDGRYGANLNAGSELTPDADVTARNAYVFLALGPGHDRLGSLGRSAFATGPIRSSFGVYGGGGDDVLVGNDRRNLLTGDGGRDRLVGNGLGDRLFGGTGRDRIEARDGHRELVDCGPGRDDLRADRVDRIRDCE